MRIVFVGVECENYAIQLFSSLLKERGHQVHLVFDPRLFGTDEISSNRLQKIFDIRKHNIRLIKKLNPDLIGFSVYTQDYQWSLSMARMIKKEMDTPIIFGGIHCILCPEQVLREECVDYVCIGEGEHTIVGLAEGKFVGNIVSKQIRTPYLPLIEDLDSLPMLDRDIFYTQRPLFKRGYTISTGRGCPYQCTFCASHALGEFYRREKLGKYVRQRSVESVISELARAKRVYSPSTVYFTDDVFTLNTEWLRGFSRLYPKKVALPFYCTANPGTIKEEEIYLLNKSGCQMIGFGMQSCNEQSRRTLLKRTGSNDKILQIAKLCKKIGIHFSFDHIFHLPTEPEENQLEAMRFYNKARPDVINTFTMTYLPKIELNRYLDDKTKEEVDNGKARTGMFIRNSDYYGSVFSILPLFNYRLLNWLIDKGIYRYMRFPFWLRLLFKDIRRMMIGRFSDVWFPIHLLLYNIVSNLRIKCRSYQS